MITEFYNQAVAHGGATMDIRGETPIRGYMVGMYPERTKHLTLSTIDLEHYISENYQHLRLSGNYLGVWFDDADWVYDVSKCIVNRKDAMIEAIRFKQESIYNLADGWVEWIVY